MFAEYKRDVSHNYLILHGDETINTTSYQVRILTGNTMSSILKCRMQGLDGTWLFYYDITSKQSQACIPPSCDSFTSFTVLFKPLHVARL